MKFQAIAEKLPKSAVLFFCRTLYVLR